MKRFRLFSLFLPLAFITLFSGLCGCDAPAEEKTLSPNVPVMTRGTAPLSAFRAAKRR